MNQEQPHTPQPPVDGTTTAGDKPPMSNTEASWHETMAGQRAAAEAQAQGSKPEAVDAVLAGASGPVTVAGFTLRPASQGTIFTMQKMASLFEAYATAHNIPSSGNPDVPKEREMYETALSTLIFADARRVNKMLDDGKLPELLKEADQMIWEMDLDTIAALNSHFSSEFDRVLVLSGKGKTAGEPGKPHPAIAAGGSNGIATVPPAEESPSSNG